MASAKARVTDSSTSAASAIEVRREALLVSSKSLTLPFAVMVSTTGGGGGSDGGSSGGVVGDGGGGEGDGGLGDGGGGLGDRGLGLGGGGDGGGGAGEGVGEGSGGDGDGGGGLGLSGGDDGGSDGGSAGGAGGPACGQPPQVSLQLLKTLSLSHRFMPLGGCRAVEGKAHADCGRASPLPPPPVETRKVISQAAGHPREAACMGPSR